MKIFFFFFILRFEVLAFVVLLLDKKISNKQSRPQKKKEEHILEALIHIYTCRFQSKGGKKKKRKFYETGNKFKT